MLISKELISNILSQSENNSTFELFRLRYAFSIFPKELQDKIFWGYIVILVFFLSVVILLTKYAPKEQNNWFREERIDKNYKLVRDIAGIIAIGLIAFGLIIYFMW
jgi:hypothetical protein